MVGEVEIIFDTFDEAMTVHRKAFEMLKKTGFITYADLLYIAQNDQDAVYPDKYYQHGWYNLFYAKVEPCEDCVNGEWVLKMPKIKSLKEKKMIIKYKKEKEIE